MKRTCARLLCFALCFVLLSNIRPTDAGSKPIIFPPTISAPNPPIDPASGLPFESRNSAFDNSHSTATSTSTVWTKYDGNPVLNVGLSGNWDSGGVGLPSVLFKDNRYRLWYSGRSGPDSGGQIGYATSSDGVSWTKSSNNPVLAVGASGAWDSGFVYAPHVIYHNGLYRMWYRGTRNKDTSAGAGIGYATSADGVNWTKYAGNPVLRVGTAGSWDGGELWSNYVAVEGTTYKMWYSACENYRCQIGYATSPDGMNWTKYAGNPILSIGSSGEWDSVYAYYPDVVFNGSVYEMWYSGYNGSTFAIGYATSTDGINWNKLPNNPVIATGPMGSWESHAVIATSVIPQTSSYRMWYTGQDESIISRIGYATASSTTASRIHLPIVLR